MAVLPPGRSFHTERGSIDLGVDLTDHYATGGTWRIEDWVEHGAWRELHEAAVEATREMRKLDAEMEEAHYRDLQREHDAEQGLQFALDTFGFPEILRRIAALIEVPARADDGALGSVDPEPF
jgi:hypothetical protein